MERINFLKRRYLDKKARFFIVNSSGEIIEHENDLKDFLVGNFFDIHPFFETIPYIINEDFPEQSFPCIQLEIGDMKGVYDITVNKRNDNYYFAMFDFTLHYQASHTLAQQKNESEIQRQLIQIENNNIALEKELVDLKNEQLKKSQEFKDEFLANMSHEIRTPLNAILGFSNLLQEFKNTPEQKQYLDAVSISGENLKVIINDILDMSKIEAGKLEISNKKFEFGTLISNLKETYKLRLKEREIDLIFNTSSDIPNQLKGDAIRVNQILINLLENAFKFTQKGSIELHVETLKKTTTKVHLQFTVKDSGIGIKKEKLDAIFESFSQAHDNNAKNYGGTGLGLTISKNLVQLMNGTINVTSVFGKGTSFIFDIDFDSVVEKTLSDKKFVTINIDEIKSKNIQVLLAEDVKINQLLAKKILNNYGFITTIANNGQEALEKLQERNFDILLLDLRMPVLDGYQTIEQIRSLENSTIKNIPVIALTAHAMVQEKEKCEKLGMDDYLSKPFDQEDLIKKILRLI